MAVETERPAAPPERPVAAARPRPKREREEELLVWPDLVFVEFISAVLFTLTFMLLSVFINAPLLNRANTDITPNPSKAPWYFLNLQELLLHMDKAWAGVILPIMFLGFLAVIPYLDRSSEKQGVWFGTKYSARIALVAALYAIVVTWGLVLFDDGERSKFEYATRWIPSCDMNAESGQPEAHQFPPCLVDTAAGHQGIVRASVDLQGPPQGRFMFSVGSLDWPADVDHIPWPFNDNKVGCWSFKNIHGWCGEHFNLAGTFAQQIFPLSTIAFLTVLIIYILFRIGWVRTTRDVMIVMFTGALSAYLTLTIVMSFFRGPGQDLILPTDIKVDCGTLPSPPGCP
ncbi:MAG: hypothetical protein HYS09_03965 [Chloroflexi bacterium]|nr:hypothetical protein [Chloroflexota bacterium]